MVCLQETRALPIWHGINRDAVVILVVCEEAISERLS
jgi:hypothetical protein